MPSIKMKVLNYDQESSSLIVVFAAENAQKSIDEYSPCAYQPTMFDTQEPEKVIENIARSGIFIADRQEKEEQFKKNIELSNQYKQYIGKEFVFDIDTLLKSADQAVDSYVQSASIVDDILEEIVIENDFTNDTQEKSN
jgi:hypothetical protein